MGTPLPDQRPVPCTGPESLTSQGSTELNINPTSTTDKWPPQVQEVTSATKPMRRGKMHLFGSLYMKSTKFLFTLPDRLRACYDELRTAGEQNPTLSLDPDCPCSWPMEHEMDNQAGLSTTKMLSLSPATTDFPRLLTDTGPEGNTEGEQTVLHGLKEEPPLEIGDTATPEVIPIPKTPRSSRMSLGGSKCSIDKVPGTRMYSGREGGKIGPTRRTETNSTIQPQQNSVLVEKTQHKLSQMQSDLQLRGLSAHQRSVAHLSVGGYPAPRQSLQGPQLETCVGRNIGPSVLGRPKNALATGSGTTDRTPPTERLCSGMNRRLQTTNVVIDSLASDTAVSEQQVRNLGVQTQRAADQCLTRPNEKSQTYTSMLQVAIHSTTPGVSEHTKHASEAPQGSISAGSVSEAPLIRRLDPPLPLPPLLRSSSPKAQKTLTTLNQDPIGIPVVEPVHTTRRVARPHSRLAKIGIVKAGDFTPNMHLSSNDHRPQSDDTTPLIHGLQPLNTPRETGLQAVHTDIHHGSFGKGSNTSNVGKPDGETKTRVDNTPKLPLPTSESPDEAPDPLKDFEKLAGMSQKWADLEAELLSEGKPLTQEQLRWAKVFRKLQEERSSSTKKQAITDSGVQGTNLEQVEGDKKATKQKPQRKKKPKKKRKHTGKERTDTADENTAPLVVVASNEFELTIHNCPPNPSAPQVVSSKLPAPGGFLFPAPCSGLPPDEGLSLPREEASSKVFDPCSQNLPQKLVSFPPLPEDFASAKEKNRGSKVLGPTPCSGVMKNNKPGSRARSQISTVATECGISPEEIVPAQSIAAAHDLGNPRTDATLQPKFVPPRRPQVTGVSLVERLTRETSKVEVEKLYKSKMKQLIMVHRIPNSSTTFKQSIVSFTRRYITDCLQKILDECDGHSALTDAVKNELSGIAQVASVLRENEVEKFVDVFLNTNIWVDVKENTPGAIGGFSADAKEESTWGLGNSTSNSQEVRRVVPKWNIDYWASPIEGEATVQRSSSILRTSPTKLGIGETVEETECSQGGTKSHTRTIILHQQVLAPRVVHKQPSLPQPRLTDGETERAVEDCSVEKVPQMAKVLRMKEKQRESDYQKLGDKEWLKDFCAEDFTQLGRHLEYKKLLNSTVRDQGGKKMDHTNAEKSIIKAPFFTTQSGDEWQYNRIYSNEYFRVLSSYDRNHSQGESPGGELVQLGKRRRSKKEGGCGVAECTGCSACPGSSNRRPCPRGQTIFTFSAGESVLLEAAIDKDKEVDLVTITPIDKRKFRSLRKAGVVVKTWDPLAVYACEKCVDSARQTEIEIMKGALLIEQKVAELQERLAKNTQEIVNAERELQAAKQPIVTTEANATRKKKIKGKKKQKW